MASRQRWTRVPSSQDLRYYVLVNGRGGLLAANRQPAIRSAQHVQQHDQDDDHVWLHGRTPFAGLPGPFGLALSSEREEPSRPLVASWATSGRHQGAELSSGKPPI
jgi:hypothetical protein